MRMPEVNDIESECREWNSRDKKKIHTSRFSRQTVRALRKWTAFQSFPQIGNIFSKIIAGFSPQNFCQWHKFLSAIGIIGEVHGPSPDTYMDSIAVIMQNTISLRKLMLKRLIRSPFYCPNRWLVRRIDDQLMQQAKQVSLVRYDNYNLLLFVSGFHPSYELFAADFIQRYENFEHRK